MAASDAKSTQKANTGNAPKTSSTKGKKQDWYMRSFFPVLFPSHPAFTLPQSEFEDFLRKQLGLNSEGQFAVRNLDIHNAATETATLVSTPPSTTADIKDALVDLKMESGETDTVEQRTNLTTGSHPFVAGLIEHGKSSLTQEQHILHSSPGKMFTENGDLTHRSSGSALVDLFSELEDVVSGPRLYELLQAAWQADSIATLKIIFNARSIHLGKSSRAITYRCFGWLAKQHPLTLVNNLQWLSRPLIEKKALRKDDDADMVMVEQEKNEDDPSRFDAENGVAHGYWKDLLNVLALSANKKLDVLVDPKLVLNLERTKNPRIDANWDQHDAKNRRRGKRDDRHAEALAAFNKDPVHRAIHLTVTRLFAAQLKTDLVRLRSGDSGARRHISLCAKWAPSQKLFHDKHTFVVSSIAEMLHPQSEYPGVADREEYLRRAREAYRKEVASLRKALEVVERDLSAKTFDKIKYDRVPSIAMNNYAPIFAEKDTERFEKYIDKVAEGKKKISGAVLLPSKLIQAASAQHGPYPSNLKRRTGKGVAKAMIDARMQNIDAKVIDGQWKALVNRIKDSGSLESSIAICDVSGSMSGPIFADGTTPLHSSIGLSLLVAEVTKPPFGGHFITFASQPSVERIDLGSTLLQKYQRLMKSHWDMTTDFVAVFEKLILPMAVKNKLPQEDMVKQIFVFSDMQFDQASSTSAGKNGLTTSYERIKKKYKKAGYEMPKLIFWNLAGGRGLTTGGDPAPKPVEHDKQGTALVSGYSQGMLKVFLDNGSFEEMNELEEPEVEFVEKEDENGDVEVQVRKKVKMDPLTTVKKAIGHKAYDMLKVYD